MKRNIFSAIAMTGLMMLAVASAQAQQRHVLNVQVPFDFTAGEKTLPAGAYTLSEISPGAYVVRSADNKAVAIVRAGVSVAARGRSGGAARVVFRKYEDRNFLAQIWPAKGGAGRELHRSSAERRLSDELKLARNPLRPELVTVTAAQN